MTPDSPQNHTAGNQIYHRRQMAAIAARWDAKAADWDRNLEDSACHLNEDRAYQRFLDHLTLVIRDHQHFCQSHGVIDAGCATALVLGTIISSFAWGIGVDISPVMIQSAQAKRLPNASFVVGDCFNLPATCPQAGAVVSRGVLLSHYGASQARALLESARACIVDGGFIFFDYLSKPGQGAYRHVAQHKTYFEEQEICELAAQSGFGAAEIYGQAGRRVRILYAERRSSESQSKNAHL